MWYGEALYDLKSASIIMKLFNIYPRKKTPIKEKLHTWNIIKTDWAFQILLNLKGIVC